VAVVAYHLDESRVSRWPRGGYGVPLQYLECLRRAGARTALVSPGEPGEPDELLEPFDGLVLVGGGDVDPARYGGTGSADVYGVEPDRDELEIALLHAAERVSLPVLAICRGMQVLNVAYGGTLHRHLPDLPGLLEHGVPVEDTQTIHDVEVVRGTALQAATGEAALRCSSHHHQGVDRVGDGFVVSGRSPDGLVEAIERPPRDSVLGWMLGVEWHPEDTAADDRAQQGLFEGFVTLARVHASAAIAGRHAGRYDEYGISDYDPAWPKRFEAEATRIRKALGEVALRIEHVGSTSVPGLAAKPVVDIQVSVGSLVPRAPFAEPLVALGYWHGIDLTIPEREYFKLDVDGRRQFHVHICEAGGEWEREHLVFRDWLREHPDDANAYADLKRGLVAEHPNDRFGYTEAKGEFIRSVVERALASIA
jgi:putative glutamine amidotransferase